MVLGRLMFRGVVLLLAFAQLGRSLEISDFYDFEKEIRLENGANKFEYVKLDTSINFFSDIYDHIYVSAFIWSHFIEWIFFWIPECRK